MPIDYNSFTRDELLERVDELELLVRELMHQHEEEHSLHQAWGKDLSHYYWNVPRDTVLLDPARADVFGLDAELLERPVDFSAVLERAHPDDRAAVEKSKRALVTGEIERSETEYRLLNAQGQWHWFHDRAIVTRRAKDGSPVVVSGLLFDITAMHRAQEKLSSVNERLRHEAETDGLTGIANHRALLQRLIHEVRLASRTDAPLSIALFDVDFFKRVNDTYGHLVGDTVLTEVGKCLAAGIRDVDVVGRYGGEEFLVIMPGTSLANAATIADRLRQAVAECEFPEGVRVTISAGVAESRGHGHTDLIGLADARLYLAKEAGRNRVVAADVHTEAAAT